MSQALAELGGVARRPALVHACGRAVVDAALRAGEVVAVGRRYTSPEVEGSRADAASVTGVLSHRSAALAWGWGVRSRPERTEVTVPRNRNVSAADQARLAVHWAHLAADDVVDDRTSRERTLLDCLRFLPFDEALAVADSALREGFAQGRMLAITRDARGPGAVQARRVAALADGRAANPFESALRATCLSVPGLSVVPQVDIHDPHWLGRPDLTDARLELVLEADSFAWHGGRRDLADDARRYNAFVVAGWWVLRFSWEEVMFHPERVRAVLEEAVRQRAHLLCPACSAA